MSTTTTGFSTGVERGGLGWSGYGAPSHGTVPPATSLREGADDQAARLRSLVQSAAPTTPLRRERVCPLVAITSGKGGVGKTTTSVNLAIALSELGHRVTLLDADLGMANADVLCGLNPTRRLEAAVLPGRPDGSTLAGIAIDAPGGFKLVPGSVGIARMAALTPADRDRVIDQLAEVEADSDVVLIDTGAGVSEGVLAFVEAADLAVVVATPEPTSMTDAYAMIKCLAPRSKDGGARLVLSVNQARDPGEAAAVHARISATARKFLGIEIAMLGSVRQDLLASDAVRARQPILLRDPRSGLARDLRDLAASLARELRLGPKESRTQAQTRPTRERRGLSALFAWRS